MIIRVAGRVLNNPRWYPLLDLIVTLIESGDSRHSFDVAQYAEIVESNWLANAGGLRAGVPDVIRAQAKSANRDIPSDAVTLNIDDRAPFAGEVDPQARTVRAHPLGSLTILSHPLHVIVEDESSDGSFVLWMARFLGKDAVRAAYSAGRLVFRHAGGKGQFVKCARALSFGVWPRPGHPLLSLRLRAIAMLDSDSRYPGDDRNRAIAAETSDHVAHVHILRRRSIENYVPIKYFRKRLAEDGKQDMADAFFRLREDQQSYFPMRRGFQTDTSPPNPVDHAQFLVEALPQERDLFRDVNAADWNALAPGFGDRLATIYEEPRFRCDPGENTPISPIIRREIEDFLTLIVRFL